MKFIKLFGIGQLSMDVLLCEVHKGDRFIFHTAVRADWEPPYCGFTRSTNAIYELDVNRNAGGYAHIWRNNSNPDIVALRGAELSNADRLRLLLGETVVFRDYLIKPA